jgi:hypothetical protein
MAPQLPVPSPALCLLWQICGQVKLSPYRRWDVSARQSIYRYHSENWTHNPLITRPLVTPNDIG